MFPSQDKDFCVFVNPADFKFCDHKHSCIMLDLNLFISTIKMKLGQILVCCMTNISNMFLAECWRLETSCRPFYDFIKMTIQQDLAIFNG